MKKFSVLLILMLMIGLYSCKDKEIVIDINGEVSTTINVGDVVNYANYFKITVDGKEISITDEMIDSSKIDNTKAGEYELKIVYEGKEKKINIKVVNNVEELKIITISSIKPIKVGEEVLLIVTKDPANNQDVVTFTSSNDKVATVDANGKVAGISVGTTTIKAVCSGKEYSIVVAVIQGETPLQSIEITNGKDLKVGETLVLTVTKDPANNQDVVTFTSSDEEIATVDNTGKVTALKAGTVSITAACKEISDMVTITISETPLQSIEITNGKDLKVGETLVLTVTKDPANNQDVVTFTSSDGAIATVDNTGKVTALKAGTVSITAACKEISDMVTITITETPVLDYEVAFNKLIDYKNWNMVITYSQIIEEITDYVYEDIYQYDGENFKNTYAGMDGNTYSDYIIVEDDVYYYYCQNEDGTYTAYNENTDEFNDYYLYYLYLDFSNLLDYEYTYKDGLLYVENPGLANDDIFGAYEETPTYESFTFKIENDNVVEMVCKYTFEEEDGIYTYIDKVVFSDFGTNVIDVEELKNNVGGGTTPDPSTVTIFTDVNLGSNGGVEYTSSRVGNSLDSIRGVQFLQADGIATITSKESQSEVKSVTVVVATNQESGMTLKVSIGNIYFICDGSESVNVPKTDFNATNSYTFVSQEALNGIVKIELIPNAQNKSMYIASIALSSSGEIVTPVGGVMPKQKYDESTFKNDRLQDYMMELDGAVGLLNTGTYNCLVIPVEFTQGSITDSELEMLGKAFNGTSADTGWESVKTYYQKSSYGKLNMSFDILDVYTTSKSASYYQNYSKILTYEDGYSIEQTGDTALLLEVLAYLEPLIDLTKYDNDNDKVIDGVYLIYDYEVAYDDSNDFFWAYTSWYNAPTDSFETFDGLDPYYYLFAGFEFMLEDAVGGNEYSGTIDGLLINSATYIHETGHMLSLDDYYDYFGNEGSNQGVGGADMMDSTVGDHCSYSKIMLDWITPKIVNETQTITIKPFEENGDTIMILLNSNDSYMSEYLLIDLYTPTNLNALHGNINYLYGDEEYGIRIYHVSSEVDEPYADEYGSFTKYNNSLTDIALLKLIQADGDTNFDANNGYVEGSDLWQTGDIFSSVYSSYTRNDGKLLNFDITIDSVNASGATITITFAE